MEKEIRCKKCNKLLAKLDKNGYCNKIFLYCIRCKQEYEYTYIETNNKNKNDIRVPREPNDK